MKQPNWLLRACGATQDPVIDQGATAMERCGIAREPADSEATSLLDQTHQQLENWVRRHLGSTGHERRVAQIAGAMFDLTQDLHDLSRRALWMLTAAALLHDVGRGFDSDDHAAAGAEQIRSNRSLPLASTMRRWLEYLVRYHRGAVPQLGEDGILRDSDDRKGLLKVLALLRAADTLDRRSMDPPRLLLMRRNESIQISCFLREPNEQAEKLRRRKKYRLLEQTLGCRVNVQLQVGDAQLVLA